MKGKQIYFTQQEIRALLLTLEDFEENASETVYAHRLKNGLGTAWKKLQENAFTKVILEFFWVDDGLDEKMHFTNKIEQAPMEVNI